MNQGTATSVDAVSANVDQIAVGSIGNPAYGAYVIARYKVPLHEINVPLNGELVTWERAVLELLDMGMRMDDPYAIQAVCNALRDGVAAQVRTKLHAYAGVDAAKLFTHERL